VYKRQLRDLDGGPEESFVAAIGLLRTRLYPEAVPGLIRLLESGSLRGKRSAAELLGSIGDPAARSALEQAASREPDQIVRSLAENALTQLSA